MTSSLSSTSTIADGSSGVIRMAVLTAAPGRLDALLLAARTNADEARRAPGCRGADVCAVPDQPEQLVVISRWSSAGTLNAFLGWHEGIAHELIARASAARPTATHYPIAGPTGP